jgi:hypothetical protein
MGLTSTSRLVVEETDEIVVVTIYTYYSDDGTTEDFPGQHSYLCGSSSVLDGDSCADRRTFLNIRNSGTRSSSSGEMPAAPCVFDLLLVT